MKKLLTSIALFSFCTSLHVSALIKTWDAKGTGGVDCTTGTNLYLTAGTAVWNDPLNWCADGVPAPGDTIILATNFHSVEVGRATMSIVADLGADMIITSNFVNAAGSGVGRITLINADPAADHIITLTGVGGSLIRVGQNTSSALLFPKKSSTGVAKDYILALGSSGELNVALNGQLGIEVDISEPGFPAFPAGVGIIKTGPGALTMYVASAPSVAFTTGKNVIGGAGFGLGGVSGMSVASEHGLGWAGTNPPFPIADQTTFTNFGTLDLVTFPGAGVLIPANHGFTMGAGGGFLQVGGTLAAPEFITLSNNVTGPGMLVKQGAGALTLAGANNDFSGGLLIQNGAVNFDGGSLGANAGTGPITVAPQSANSRPLILSHRAAGVGAALTATVTNDIIFLPSTTGIFSTLLNTVDLASGTNAGASLTFSGKFSGSQPLARGLNAAVNGVNGGSGGNVVLSGDNSGWSGGLTLIRGATTLGNQYALGTGTLRVSPASVLANNNAVLQANTALTGASAVTNPITLFVTNNASKQLAIGGSSALELSGPITIATTVSIGTFITNENSAATTLSGPISGTTSLKLFNAGSTFTLSGNSTFSGQTTNLSGTTTLGSGDILPNSTVTITGGGLDLSGSAGIGALQGAGTVALGTSTLTNGGNNASSTYSGVISDTAGGGLTKNGTGTLTLSGANTYSGLTLVNAGTLTLANASATGTGAVQVQPGATINGNGTIGGSLTVGGTVSPGTSVGGITNSSTTWSAGGTYTLEMADATGTAGTTGWDLIENSGAGGLTISSTAANPFKVNLVSLAAVNFVNTTTPQSWVIVRNPAGAVTGFDPNTVSLNTTGFTNVLAAGAGFYLSVVGTDLVLTYDLLDPVVTTQPVSQSINYGANATFNVVVASTVGGLTYQWYKDAVALTDAGSISGSATDTLTVTGASYSDAANYRCAITNGSSSGVLSAVAALAVADPIITIQPVSFAATAGVSTNLSVTAIGSATVNYQWQRGGTNIASATDSSLAFAPLAAADAGTYRVIVSGSASLQSVTSSVATLTVNTLPVVTNPPMPRVIQQGAPGYYVGFSVGASGATGYLWKSNGVTVKDSAVGAFLLTNAPVGVTTIECEITNAFGSITTNVSLTVQTGNIRLFATNLCILRIGEGINSVGGAGNATFIDQWTPDGVYVNTVTVPDTGPTASLLGSGSVASFLDRSADGRFLCFAGYNTNRWLNTASVTAAAGTAIPRVINTVGGLGFRNMAFKSTTFGSAQDFRAVATDGTNNFWAQTSAGNGTTYITPPSTAVGIQVPNIKNNQRGVHIFNGDLWISTGSGSGDGQQGVYQYSGLPTTGVPLPTPPQIYTDGTHQLINAVEDFAIDPTGLIAYVADDRPVSGDGFIGGIQRWDKIAGTWTFGYNLTNNLRPNHGATFTIRHLTVDWSGPNPVVFACSSTALADSNVDINYFYKLTDTGAGSAFVQIAQAPPNFSFKGIKFGPVTDPPTVAAQTGNLTNCLGTTANFNVVPAGTAPFYFQWKSNGVDMVDSGNIAGATTANLTLSNVQPTDAATYTCTFTNDVGTATTADATLTLDYITVSSSPVSALGVAPGSSNVFSVVASGVTTVSYQWRKNGVDLTDGGNISGATTPDLTINPSASADSAFYSVVITPDSCAVKVTNTAELAVCELITLSPATLPVGFIGVGYTNQLTADGIRGPHTFALVSGTIPAPLTLASGGELSGVPTGSSTNALVISATDTNGCIGTQAYSLVIIIFETNKPTVKFNTVPANNGTVFDSPTNITGTAKDAGVGASQVEKVLYSLNGGPTNNLAVVTGPPVAGTVNWTSSVPMIPGTNTMTIQAQDFAGNVSVPTTSTTRKYFLSVPGTYTLVTNAPGAAGSVTGTTVAGDNPGVSGAPLKIGRAYTVTAIAGVDSLFTNWTISVNGGPTTVATNYSKLTFTMNSNVVVTANFITNSFKGAAGTYYGLFNDFSVAHQSAGWFTVKTDSKLKFTGKLLLQGEVVTFTGTFNQAGHGTTKPGKVVSRKGLTNSESIILTIDLNLTTGDSLTGYMTNLAGWDADMLGDKATFNFTNNPATNFLGASGLGTHSFVYPGSLTAATEPGGDGYGLVALTTNGIVKPTGGKAGDFEKLKSVMTGISKNGDWPFYAAMYADSDARTSPVLTAKTFRGSVFGWLQFLTNGTVSGTLFWNKNPQSTNSGYYDLGFTNSETIVGSSYTKPLLSPVLVSATNLNQYPYGLLLADGNLLATITNDWFVTSLNKFFVTNAIPPKNPQGIKIAVSTAKGEIGGSFTNTATPTLKTAIKGVVLQDQQEIRGVFRGTNQSGSLRMTVSP